MFLHSYLCRSTLNLVGTVARALYYVIMDQSWSWVFDPEFWVYLRLWIFAYNYSFSLVSSVFVAKLDFHVLILYLKPLAIRINYLLFSQ